MKEITNVAIGGRSFILSKEAYEMLESYLSAFRSAVSPASQADDVMIEIEERIAEIFSESSPGSNSVIDTELVRQVMAQLGMPDGSDIPGAGAGQQASGTPPAHKFYRDMDGKKIGGVCSGIALYFNIDTVLVRILAILLIFCGGSGFWGYMIFWLITPPATTPLQKCELRGISPTAENLRKFSSRQ